MATSFYTRFPGGTATISGSVDVNIHDAAGTNITLGQKTMAASVPVVIASDQTEIINTNGSVVNGTLTATTASSESAPATAVGFILQAPSDNTNNIRFRIGGTASTTAGMQLEPGRDTGLIPIKATISICAIASGTNVYSILWVLTS